MIQKAEPYFCADPEFAALMDELIALGGPHHDTEVAHGQADDLLLKIIGKLANPATHKAIVEAYEAVDKWYS